MIKFFYNGLKVNGGKLETYWISKHNDDSNNTVFTIYKKEYNHFSKEVYNLFKVRNNTDSMTDYFETDSIIVKNDHSLFSEIERCFNISQDKIRKRIDKKCKNK